MSPLLGVVSKAGCLFGLLSLNHVAFTQFPGRTPSSETNKGYKEAAAEH